MRFDAPLEGGGFVCSPERCRRRSKGESTKLHLEDDCPAAFAVVRERGPERTRARKLGLLDA